ncbi:TVP38/TMEM64 family protein [Spirochaetota bacterium]
MAFPAFLLLLVFFTFLFREHLYTFLHSTEEIRTWVLARGRLAPLVFIALQAFQVIVFMIPGELVQMAGGFIFGLWFGTLWSVIGISLGSIFNFFVGRFLGRPFVRAILGIERMHKVDMLSAGRRIKTAYFLLFLVPGIPKDTLCYAAGASKLSVTGFMVISMLGRLPGIFGSSCIGAAVFDSKYFLSLGLLFVASAFLVLGVFYKNRLLKYLERFK